MISSAATAAAEPPEDPPGMRDVSQGFRVGKKPEFSVELPIANSSQFNRPKKTAPAAFNFAATVASYGATNLPRIFDPQFSGWPLTAITSLTAIGTPSKGCSEWVWPEASAWSAASAWASASAAS